MAQFTAHGRLKSLVNSDGIAFGYDLKDSKRHHHHHHDHHQVLGGGGGGGGGRWRFTVLPSLKRKSGCTRTRVYASNSPSLSSSANRSKKFNKAERDAAASADGVLEEVTEEIEFEQDELASFRGLVLDISYRPVNVVCWRRAICLEFMEKADVLEYYDQTVNSPSGSFYIPAVLRVPHLLQVVKRRRIKSNLSRKNILYRDNFTCQYCSSGENLTIDHVVPIARGGEWTWENLVTACAKCNSRKGQKTVEEANMKLLKVPKTPKDYDILAIPLTNKAIKTLRMKKGTPEEWHQYLSKPAP